LEIKRYTEKILIIAFFSEGVGMTKRMKEALIGGALLGIVCVVGAYIRSGSTASPIFVFSLWYNRVIIGLAVGAPWKTTSKGKALLRGALLGLLVSFAFYCSTDFQDPISFVAGIVYGALIEGWLSRSKK
jgi:uncharacterized membrane protein